MTMPTALNSGEPARIGAGGDTVTLVEGATFCLSDRHGDVVAGGSHGFFFRDAALPNRLRSASMGKRRTAAAGAITSRTGS